MKIHFGTLFVLSTLTLLIGCGKETKQTQVFEHPYIYESKDEVVKFNYSEKSGNIQGELIHMTKDDGNSSGFKTREYKISGSKLDNRDGFAIVGEEKATKEPKTWVLARECVSFKVRPESRCLVMFRETTGPYEVELRPIDRANENR